MLFKFLGTTDEVTTCDCCGRSDLKSTVAIENLDTGEQLHYGCACAANALRMTSKEVKAETKRADDARWKADQDARAIKAAEQSAKRLAFLIAATGGIKDWQGHWDIFAMHQQLGGFKAAMALMQAIA